MLAQILEVNSSRPLLEDSFSMSTSKIMPYDGIQQNRQPLSIESDQENDANCCDLRETYRQHSGCDADQFHLARFQVRVNGATFASKSETPLW
jgi:hypothetical protein